MKPVDARQRFGAAAMAISITFSIIWGLSSYAYGGPHAVEVAPSASGIAQVRACS